MLSVTIRQFQARQRKLVTKGSRELWGAGLAPTPALGSDLCVVLKEAVLRNDALDAHDPASVIMRSEPPPRVPVRPRAMRTRRTPAEGCVTDA